MSKQKEIETIMETILIVDYLLQSPAEDSDLWQREDKLDLLLRLYRLKNHITTQEAINGFH